MSTEFEIESNLTAKPKSAIAQDPLFLTSIFLLLRSLWAIAGLPNAIKGKVHYILKKKNRNIKKNKQVNTFKNELQNI